MTLYVLMFYAFTSSTKLSDSERMAAQFISQPTLDLVQAPPGKLPLDIHDNDNQIAFSDEGKNPEAQ